MKKEMTLLYDEVLSQLDREPVTVDHIKPGDLVILCNKKGVYQSTSRLWLISGTRKCSNGHFALEVSAYQNQDGGEVYIHSLPKKTGVNRNKFVVLPCEICEEFIKKAIADNPGIGYDFSANKFYNTFTPKEGDDVYCVLAGGDIYKRQYGLLLPPSLPVLFTENVALAEHVSALIQNNLKKIQQTVFIRR